MCWGFRMTSLDSSKGWHRYALGLKRNLAVCHLAGVPSRMLTVNVLWLQGHRVPVGLISRRRKAAAGWNLNSCSCCVRCRHWESLFQARCASHFSSKIEFTKCFCMSPLSSLAHILAPMAYSGSPLCEDNIGLLCICNCYFDCYNAAGQQPTARPGRDGHRLCCHQQRHQSRTEAPGSSRCLVLLFWQQRQLQLVLQLHLQSKTFLAARLTQRVQQLHLSGNI